MADTVAIRVDGLKEFRAGLRGIDAAWAKELNSVNKAVAQKAAADARAEAEGKGGVYAKAAAAIKPMGPYATSARVGISPNASTAMANATFWGALARSGWNAGWRNGTKTARRNLDGKPQHPRWVGSAWDVAVTGQGPHALNDALARNVDHYLHTYYDALVDLAERAAFH